MDGPVLYEEKMMEGFCSWRNVDAVYMTNCGYRTERIPEYLTPLYAEGIPVFSQTGKNDVVNGATLTIYRRDSTKSAVSAPTVWFRLWKGNGRVN